MISLIPIQIAQAPNVWTPLQNKFWTVTANMTSTLQGFLQTDDPYGKRPYVPALGATLQAVFQRGDNIGGNTTTLTVTKLATFDVNFRSLATFTLTAQDATNVISGTVLFTLTEGSSIQQWSQNWAVKKLNTSAGC